MHYFQDSLYATKVHLPDFYGLTQQTCRRNRIQHELSSPETLDSPTGYVVLSGLHLLWSHPSLSCPPYGLFSSSIRSLPDGLVEAGQERFPNLLSISLFPCHLPYSEAMNECMWLFLLHSLWPSSSLQRVGLLILMPVGSHIRSVTKLQSSLYATAWKLARPSPTRTFTTELPPCESPQQDVSYNYTGKQPIPVTRLPLARYRALWAASRGRGVVL